MTIQTVAKTPPNYVVLQWTGSNLSDIQDSLPNFFFVGADTDTNSLIVVSNDEPEKKLFVVTQYYWIVAGNLSFTEEGDPKIATIAAIVQGVSGQTVPVGYETI